MDLLLVQIINAMMQLLLFSLIPLLWWFCTARKKESFFSWIGLKLKFKDNKIKVILFSLVTLIVYAGLSIYVLFLLKDVQLATSEFEDLGINGVPAAIVYSFIKTGLSEEIVFRGFILKRLSNKVGFQFANIIQSLLFGLLHGIIFLSFVNPITALMIIILTGTIGWIMGYINEIKADGSIIPSWIIHGLANLFSSIISLFSLI